MFAYLVHSLRDRHAGMLVQAGHGRVDYRADWRQVPELVTDLSAGDVLLTLGAGDIYRLGQQLVAEEAA